MTDYIKDLKGVVHCMQRTAVLRMGTQSRVFYTSAYVKKGCMELKRELMNLINVLA